MSNPAISASGVACECCVIAAPADCGELESFTTLYLTVEWATDCDWCAATGIEDYELTKVAVGFWESPRFNCPGDTCEWWWEVQCFGSGPTSSLCAYINRASLGGSCLPCTDIPGGVCDNLLYEFGDFGSGVGCIRDPIDSYGAPILLQESYTLVGATDSDSACTGTVDITVSL